MKGINKAAYQIDPHVEGCECTLEVVHTAFDAPPAFGIKFCALHAAGAIKESVEQREILGRLLACVIEQARFLPEGARKELKTLFDSYQASKQCSPAQD